MLEIVDLFREKGTVDELGVGTIRDAFADYLFPGTSTLHSRARYFLFIPWVYRHLEHERVKGAQMNDRARALQAQLVGALSAGGESEGVIGIEARDKLIRAPSVVYWGALRRLGLRLFPGSTEQYHSSIDAWYASGRDGDRGEDGGLLDGSRPNWHPGLPETPAGIWQKTDFSLSNAEGAYLRERILATTEGSLLAFCLHRPRPLQKIARPWGLPNLVDAEPQLRASVLEAQRFALLMEGAVLVYNLLLAEASRDAGLRDEGLIDRYRESLRIWADGRIRPVLDELRVWHEAGTLWDCIIRIGPRSSVPARRFARQWITEALADPWQVGDVPAVRQLIAARERSLKVGLARLGNRRALERWSGESGLGELQYRWTNAQVLINDIAAALRRDESPPDA
jgi:hypothetical protein